MDNRQAARSRPSPDKARSPAIQEIVEILMADPKTDWSKVNINSLRQHLMDVNNVTLAANVKNEPIDGGMRFNVMGEGPVRNSIRRVTTAHAATMNGVDGWKFEAVEIEGGAWLRVHAPAKEADKLRGLGFLGVLTLGMGPGGSPPDDRAGREPASIAASSRPRRRFLPATMRRINVRALARFLTET